MKQEETGHESVVDDDLVGFFDALARFDYEDKQKEKFEFKADPPNPVREGQL